MPHPYGSLPVLSSDGRPATASSKLPPSGSLPTAPRAKPRSTTSHTSCHRRRDKVQEEHKRLQRSPEQPKQALSTPQEARNTHEGCLLNSASNAETTRSNRINAAVERLESKERVAIEKHSGCRDLARWYSTEGSQTDLDLHHLLTRSVYPVVDRRCLDLGCWRVLQCSRRASM